MSAPATALPAMLSMAGAALLLTANEAIVKVLTLELGFGQLMSLRSGFAVLVLLPALWSRGGLRLAPAGRLAAAEGWMLLLRCAALTGSVFLFLWGLSLLPLASAMALVFTAPLFATLLGAGLLGERVGRWRWAALAVGFAGVLLITAPDGRIAWPALLPLGAAAGLGLSDMATRRLMQRASAPAVLLYSHAFIAFAGLATALDGGWDWPGLRDLAWIAAASLLFSLGLLLQMEAFRRADVSKVAPLRYLALVFAVLLGWWVWDELPGLGAVAGAAMIVVSGALVWRLDRS